MGRKVQSNRNKKAQNHEHVEQVAFMGAPMIDNSRIVMLHGDVTEQSIAQVMAQIIHFATGSIRPIQLIVSSYGGSVHETLALCDLIRTIECPVHTIGLGKIMSAGTIVMSMGEKGKRLIGATTRVMLHAVSGGAMGTVFQMENDIAESKALQDTVVKILQRQTKMTIKQLNDIMVSGRDHYITAHEAVKLGIADKIIGE